MTTKTQCYVCGRTATGCRQVLRCELGDGWYIAKAMSGDVVENVKKRWKDKYICPECYDFEVRIMHSRITFKPSFNIASTNDSTSETEETRK